MSLLMWMRKRPDDGEWRDGAEGEIEKHEPKDIMYFLSKEGIDELQKVLDRTRMTGHKASEFRIMTPEEKAKLPIAPMVEMTLHTYKRKTWNDIVFGFLFGIAVCIVLYTIFCAKWNI